MLDESTLAYKTPENLREMLFSLQQTLEEKESVYQHSKDHLTSQVEKHQEEKTTLTQQVTQQQILMEATQISI